MINNTKKSNLNEEREIVIQPDNIIGDKITKIIPLKAGTYAISVSDDHCNKLSTGSLFYR